MRQQRLAAALAAAFPLSFSPFAFAQAVVPQPVDGHIKSLGTVTVTGGQPTSLPTQIPTTIEGVTGAQIAQTINATDSEDALKYLPSLNVRKRYIGDFNHAVLASRASGTGNSARSLVYADGILLSNLLGNGATYAPRWGLVTPEEIERVDVLYGPFSAAYSGNSVGAVVDYQTRMPKQLEAHVKLGYTTSNFDLYNSHATHVGKTASASIGSKSGDWSWFINVNRLDSDGQPLVFANKLVSSGAAGAAGIKVTGAVAGRNPNQADWWLVGASTQYHTVQDHAKIKLAYDFSPTLTAAYTLGWWDNTATSHGETYLRDAVTGAPVYSGNVNIDGKRYTLANTDISTNRNQLTHVMQGVSVKNRTRGVFDWELSGSVYDYQKDIGRAPLVALPDALKGGAGRITDMNGTGWNNLAAKGIWRPSAEQTIDFGVQRDSYQLRTLVSDTGNWISGDPGKRFSAFNGNSTLTSFYAQDSWKFAPNWRTTLGARYEQWHAYGGELGNARQVLGFNDRRENFLSPKAAIAYQATPQWALKASLGRAVRMPTVAELYQGSVGVTAIVNNDPHLKPEKSWTGELTAERDLGQGLLRATYFHERTSDALYTQTNVTVSPNVTNIQNVDRIVTRGFELAYQANDVFVKGLDLSGSLTFADSIIEANARFPASVGKWQPRVPRWRANLLASYKPDAHWSATLGLRYSGQQYGTLDNSDLNGFAYTGVSSFLVADVRLRYQFNRQWSASFGIDNLNNRKYWAFHPYPQRTYSAELKWDL